jgi:gas vesicle protein
LLIIEAAVLLLAPQLADETEDTDQKLSSNSFEDGAADKLYTISASEALAVLI